MSRLQLLWRGIRWRLGAAIALLVVATVGVLAAGAGPLYLETAKDSVLHSVLLSHPASDNGLTVVPKPTAFNSVRSAQTAIGEARKFGLYRWYTAGKLVMDAGMSVSGPTRQAFGGDLVSDPGDCAFLVFISGSCPRAPGEVAVTERSATALGVKLGSHLTTSVPGPIVYANGLPTQTSQSVPVVVTAIIKAENPTQPFWFGADFFGFGNSCPPKAPRCLPQLDSFFTPPATVLHITGTTAQADFALKVNSLHLSGVGAFTSHISNYTNQLNTTNIANVRTQINAEIGQERASSQLMQSIVLVVDLELVLLALFVLFGLVARTAEARQKEVALAKLRGFRLPSVLAVGLVEPLAMLCLALPLGLGLAVLLVAGTQPLLLPGARLSFDNLVIWAALAAFGGGVLAVALGARRILTRKLVDELRTVETGTSRAAAAALDAGALALAVAGIVELLAVGVLGSGQANPLAAFAPGLVAVAVAVIGVRGLPLLANLVVRRTRAGVQLAWGLAVRQVVRRPTSLRQITVLTVATGLCCFAVAGWAAAGVNRVSRAEFDLGAARVLTVSVPAGVNVVNAVDRADPSGRYAMAVMLSKIPSQNLLAVQASRLRQVAYWSPGVSRVPLSTLVRWLTPHLQPALVLTGRRARITVDMVGNPSPPPDLVLNLVDSAGQPEVADFGYLQPGLHTYTTSMPPGCAGGCHVLQLDPIWTPSQTFSPLQGPTNNGPQLVNYTLQIPSLETAGATGAFRNAAAQLNSPSYWASSGPGMAVSSTTFKGTNALRLNVTDSASQTNSPAVSPGALPPVVHGVVTSANSVQDPAAASVEDFDGNSLTLNVKYKVSALPQLGGTGFLMDLTTALRAETSPPSQTQTQVWLAPGAPASIVRSLRGDGIRVLGTQVPATAIRQMNAGGLALAYLFFLFAAAAAALLAIGAAVFSVFMSSRRRAFELAVLRAIGVTDTTLLRSLVAEQLLVLMPGVVLGVVAGVVGAILALPAVPEFSTSFGSPPVQLVLVPLPIILTVVALILVLGAAAAAASLATLRLASWARLRTEVA